MHTLHPVSSGLCILDMAVYVEQLRGDPLVDHFHRMPVNAMRNLAIAMARTDVRWHAAHDLGIKHVNNAQIVGIVDADFMVGPRGFVTELNSAAGHDAARAILEQQKTLWIMPSLEYNASAMTFAEGRSLTAALARGMQTAHEPSAPTSTNSTKHSTKQVARRESLAIGQGGPVSPAVPLVHAVRPVGGGCAALCGVLSAGAHLPRSASRHWTPGTTWCEDVPRLRARKPRSMSRTFLLGGPTCRVPSLTSAFEVRTVTTVGLS